MKIAVTGASGYIGKEVVKCLQKLGHDVTVLLRASSEDRFVASDKLKIIIGDIREVDDNIFMKLGCPELLIHLAWGGLPNYHSINHFENELLIQYCFLKNLVSNGLKKLFITGTCFEYGLQNGCIRPDTVTNPQNPYGFAKDSLRKKLFFLQSLYNFELIWARLFYIYGENQAKTTLYGSLVDKIRTGADSFDLSEGEQLRDYLHVNEVADLIVQNSLVIYETKIINICSGTPISVRKFAESIVKAEKSNIILNFGVHPYSPYEPMAFWGEPNLRTK
jgi:dTDP-6-deoxy-L-talose 4-dehydrogenase (NAD+)